MKQRLMMAYHPKVQDMAWRRTRTLPPGCLLAMEDLVNEGMIALAQAIELFDPARRTKFWTYAARRVWGAMCDALRGVDFVPRSARRRMAAGTLPEVRMGSIEEVTARGESRDRRVADGLADPADRLSELIGRDAMQRLLGGLGRRERLIMTLYYVAGLKFKEISRVIGVCETRVHQIHGQTIQILREKLSQGEEEEQGNG